MTTLQDDQVSYLEGRLYRARLTLKTHRHYMAASFAHAHAHVASVRLAREEANEVDALHYAQLLLRAHETSRSYVRMVRSDRERIEGIRAELRRVISGGAP